VEEAVEEAVEEEVEEEEEVAEEAEQQQPQEQEMRNSSERNHPPSMGIDKTSIDSSQTFKGTCP
jgi:hypothetical protein